MLTLYQRLIFGYVLLLALLLAVGLHDSLSLHQAAALDHHASLSAAVEARAALARRATMITAVCVLGGIAITIGFLVSIIRPIRRTAAAARRIGQGELQQRIEWRTRDDLGTIAIELNRMAVRLRDLRDTEYGRKQMDQQLSDAVVQSIFEPVIVTDATGHVLKLNQAANEVLGEAAADRMALTNTPGGERILRAVRDAVSMRQSIASEDEAAMLPMKLGEGHRSYRLRTTPMRDAEGKLLGAVSVLEDITEMQDIDRFKTRFLSVASQKLRQPLEQLRLSLYTLAQGFAGELRPLQADVLHGAEEDAERLNDLMSDLIEVSELDTGRRELRMDRFRPGRYSSRRLLPGTRGSARQEYRCADRGIRRPLVCEWRSPRSAQHHGQPDEQRCPVHSGGRHHPVTGEGAEGNGAILRAGLGPGHRSRAAGKHLRAV